MTTVANKMREIAKNAEKNFPAGVKEIETMLVEAVAESAKMGLFGVGLTLQAPEELHNYIPHIIGDLRGGGLTVDVINVTMTVQGTDTGLFITW